MWYETNACSSVAWAAAGLLTSQHGMTRGMSQERVCSVVFELRGHASVGILEKLEGTA